MDYFDQRQTALETLVTVVQEDVDISVCQMAIVSLVRIGDLHAITQLLSILLTSRKRELLLTVVKAYWNYANRDYRLLTQAIAKLERADKCAILLELGSNRARVSWTISRFIKRILEPFCYSDPDWHVRAAAGRHISFTSKEHTFIGSAFSVLVISSLALFNFW